MSPPREPSTPQAALHALVVELFSADELRRWLRHGPYADLLPEVPEGGSLAELADRTLAALERRGRIDAAFFERLAAERPHKKTAIDAVAERWASRRSTTPTPTPANPAVSHAPPQTSAARNAPRRAATPAQASQASGAARFEVEGDFVAGSKTVHNHYYGAPSGAPTNPTTSATRTTAPTATAPTTSTGERLLAAWVHVSDLHFGHGDPSHQWNQVRVLDALLSDICELVKARKVPAPGLILVTGDVAYSGGARPTAKGEAEYALAAEWLGRLGTALDLAKERVFVVPGNHDVDRGVDRDKDIAGMVKLARYGDDGHKLDDLLGDPTQTARLRARLARYLAFAAGFGPAAGTTTPVELWWEHREPLPEGLTLRLCGLNTALLAAKDDKGRLRVGEQQLAKLLRVTAPTELTVVLAHHPAAGGWLADEKELDGALDERAVAYLSGHVHEARSVQVHKGAGEGCLHVSAGAAHAEAASADAPPASHGYNVGALVVLASGELAVRIWPRRWSLARPRFEVDTANTRRNENYAEHRLGERYRLVLPDPRSGLHPGDLLGERYRLVETLGEGGVGQVWKAEDTSKRGEAVAVKVLNPDGNPSPPHRRELFFRGPTSMRKVAHPAIVKIIDPNPDPGHRHGPYDFYVMDFVPGTNLSKRFKGRGCGEAQAIEVMLKIAEGLAAAHAKEVIHRDLKPSNVLLGDDGRVTIVDFDTAKELKGGDNTDTISVQALATEAYTAPEIKARRNVDARADVYSLGLIGLFLISGQDPSPGHVYVPDEIDALHCSSALRAALRRACGDRAEKRYALMTAFAAALRGLTQPNDAPTKVAPPPKPKQPTPTSPRQPGTEAPAEPGGRAEVSKPPRPPLAPTEQPPREPRQKSTTDRSGGRRWLPVGAGVGVLSVVVALLVNASGSCRKEVTPPPGTEASAGSAAATNQQGVGEKPAPRAEESEPEVKPEEPATPPPMRCPEGQVAEGSSCVARCPEGTALIEGGSFKEHTISDFCMDITEVTVAAFRAQASAESFEKARTRHFDGVTPKGDVWCNARYSDRDAHPINCVDWEQAEAYCKSQGNRLPTEWEWEWAARGRDKGRKYPWGDDEPRAELVNACGSECVKEAKRVLGGDWKSMYSDDDGHASTAPVGSKPAGKSWDKLQDMAGNVWEWTSSSEGDRRVLRGGGWTNGFPVYLSASARYFPPPSTRHLVYGFRCARTAR